MDALLSLSPPGSVDVDRMWLIGVYGANEPAKSRQDAQERVKTLEGAISAKKK